MTLSSEHVVQALSRIDQITKSKTTAKHTAPAVSVAISRQTGALGSEIARAVGARLNWAVYDKELLELIAQEKGLQKSLLEHLDERYISWLEQVVTNFSTLSNLTEATYLKQLMHVLAALAKAGHCVIVGRGAAHVLPVETTLRVRIVAPREARIINAERTRGLTRAEAERWLDKTDADRHAFSMHYFHNDNNDPASYDLLLNSQRFSTDDCVALIAEGALKLEKHVQAKWASPATGA
jgi:cytidylate kinase